MTGMKYANDRILGSGGSSADLANRRWGEAHDTA
jgi:hypothetical protein